MTEFLDEGSPDRGPIASSMIEGAQKAVGDGDYAGAERLLRQAATIQEAALGSHPDLATTLNNLAFVCERLNKFEEAERGYRRAHAIAVASLPPGHSLIKTSLSNLVEFCAARGIPIWTPPEAPAEEKPVADDVESAPQVSVTADVAREPMAVSRLPLRIVAVAAVLVVAVVVILIAVGPKGPAVSGEPKGPAAPGEQPQGTTEVSPSVASARTETAPPIPVAPAPSKATATVPPPAPKPTVPPKPRPEPVTASTSAPVSVLKAQLCSGLDRRGTPDWQCTTASGEVPPGRYLFYTRLLAKAGTTVEHRWLRDGRVHQSVRLRITPNPGSGYRTFSGTTIGAERAGEWKIELRSADGKVLHEERFLVR
jgi:DUF2914 family protein/tetratricopeptide repeat protein